jgi:alpha-D-xyloside xylohydrolase
MKKPPVVDRLDTRLLESRRVTRTRVEDCTVLEADSKHLLLGTNAEVASRLVFDEDLASITERLDPGAVQKGRLRVDLVTDSIVRVRYAEGDAVPENVTPMVVGRFDGPTKSEVKTAVQSAILTTADAVVEVGLRPFTLHVRNRAGEEVCCVGGHDKNSWSDFGIAWDSYNTGICRTLDTGNPLAVEVFALRPHEAVYGFGEKFIRLNKVGQTIDLNMVEALGVTTPRSYKNVPFFMSTRGYGVFFNHSARMTCWVGSLCAADLQVAIEDEFLDYFIILGDLKEILSRYTDITGKGRVPPLWSFGYWQSKMSYQSAGETLDVVRRMRAAEVPMDVLHLDTYWFHEDWRCDLEFDPDRFSDPAAYMTELESLGVKVCLWQLPYIPEGSALFDELKAAGAFAKTPEGEIYDVGICMTAGFSGVVGCIDFTNPAAREIYGRHLRRLFALGARVIKVDFGEQAPLDAVYHDGTPGWRMHNLYPLLYNRTVAEITTEATGEQIIWARSAWAGSQRYPLHWGGDSSANWYNLIPQIEGGLSFGLSGFQFWSQDIGGFLGHPNGALLIRWLQAGLFLSHARIHGVGDRELYKFEGDVLRIGREFIRLRYRLLPYLYGTAMDCVERSLPMARALVVEYQDDPNTWNIGDQWLLGDALLVAPIFDESNRRAVYLPAGVWTDWWTGERLSGGRWIAVTADLETLPLFVREGGIIPLGPAMNYVDEKPVDKITLRIAPFDSEGESRFEVRVGDELVAVRYSATAGRHAVHIGEGRVPFAIDVLGPEPPGVEVVRGRC